MIRNVLKCAPSIVAYVLCGFDVFWNVLLAFLIMFLKNSVHSDCTRECKESVNFSSDLGRRNCCYSFLFKCFCEMLVVSQQRFVVDPLDMLIRS